MENEKLFTKILTSPPADLDHTPGSWFLSQLERFFREELKKELGISSILAKQTVLDHLRKVPPDSDVKLTVSLKREEKQDYVEAKFFVKEKNVCNISVNVKIIKI